MTRPAWLAIGFVAFGMVAPAAHAEPASDAQRRAVHSDALRNDPAESDGEPDEGTAAAQILADAAAQLIASGRYDEGCDQYERSELLDPSPRRMLKVAECNERRGRTASAWTAFTEALDLADDLQDEASARAAHQGVRRLEPGLGKIQIIVPDAAAGVVGLEIRRDGVPVPPTAFGVPIPVDPGDHVVAASAPRCATWSVQLGLARGPAQVSVTIPVLDQPALEPAKSPANEVLVDPFASSEMPAPERLLLLKTGSGLPADDGRASPTSFASTQRTVGWLLGVAGGVSIAAGTALGLTTDSRLASQASASTALLGLGVTALAAGVVVYVTSPTDMPPRARATAFRVGPQVSGSSLGVSAAGSF
ncbi:MAG TPA: hypothetical protein VGL19_15415 [Polyangiaceae bacterium]|jgi:hypothetical protein